MKEDDETLKVAKDPETRRGGEGSLFYLAGAILKQLDPAPATIP